MKIVLPLLLSVFVFFVSSDAILAQSATSSSTVSATTTSTSSSTATTSTTKGGVTDMPTTLPQTGAFETTIALVALGLLTIGIGMYTHYALPLVLEEE